MDTVIKKIDLHPYRIPYRQPFKTFHGEEKHREGVIIEIITDDGLIGLGEMAPLQGFGQPDLKAAYHELVMDAQEIEDMVLDEAMATLWERLGRQKFTSTGGFGLDTAIHDLSAQSLGNPFAEQVNMLQFRSRVPVNTVIGAQEIEVVVRQAEEAVARGFKCIKLKVGVFLEDEEEIERIKAVRKAIGPDIHLRLDPNEGWTVTQAYAVMGECRSFNIQYVEQPLVRSKLDANFKDLRRKAHIPIALDESITDRAAAHGLIKNKVADVMVIKPQILGGIINTQEIIDKADRQKVQCVLTSSIEAGIGVAATLHMAAANPQITLECGLATLDLLADDLIEEQLPIIDGFMVVPHGPGLGVHLDHAALEKYRLKL